jgi:hypothetical protein
MLAIAPPLIPSCPAKILLLFNFTIFRFNHNKISKHHDFCCSTVLHLFHHLHHFSFDPNQTKSHEIHVIFPSYSPLKGRKNPKVQLGGPAVQVAAGAEHSCARMVDGTLQLED